MRGKTDGRQENHRTGRLRRLGLGSSERVGSCTVDVSYDTAYGPFSVVMYGVPSDEVYGPSRRLLNITYQSGSATDPTTNDMPDALWIGFGAVGLACMGWGVWWRLRRKGDQRKLTVAPADGALTSAAVTTALISARADQPGPNHPARSAGRGPRWVADKSVAITIRRTR
jgi:hypothetical protein